MVKTKRNIIFALFAAAALIFAAGCSDGSDEAWNESSNTGGESASAESKSSANSNNQDSGEAAGEESSGGVSDNTGGGGSGEASSLTAITASQVEALLQKIGAVVANSDDSSCYWNFAKGELDASGEDTTFAVPLNNTSSYLPSTKTTISSLKEKGRISTDLLTVNLSDAEWEIRPRATSTKEGAVETGTTTGTVIANIELAASTASSYALPESLTSVTIVLESDNWRYTV